MRVSGVSFSSDRKLVRCEQMFSYRYDEKLKPRIKSKGLYMGDYIHQLLEAFRLHLKDPKLPDWKTTFKRVKKEMWDKLFDEEKEMYEENGFTPQLAYDLFEHYEDHWETQHKKWKIVQVEKSYEIPTRFGFPIRFKADCIVQEGKWTILVENKNKKSLPESDERILNPQPHSYCFLLGKSGIKIDRILFDYICTTPVTSPQVLKNGSLSKRKINTDQRTYLKAMKEAGIKPKGDEVIGVQNYISGLPETLSLLRVSNIPNPKIGLLFIRDWVDRARRAQTITHPTRNWQRDCKWDCDYMALCQIDMLGKDRSTEIKKNFVQITKPTEEIEELK
jgi:PD-(D/E)XK nuclease superfamily protein